MRAIYLWKIAVILYYIFLVCIEHSVCQEVIDSKLEALWNPFVEIQENCPRFIYVRLGTDGMGDQVERISLGLALAAKYEGFTIVTDVELGRYSKHDKGHVYAHIYHNILGLPQFKVLSSISKSSNGVKLKKRLLQQTEYADYLTGAKDMGKEEKCHVVLDVDVFDMCRGTWCPFILGWDAENVAKPIYQASFELSHGRAKCINATNPVTTKQHNDGMVLAAPLPNAIQVVWHVRMSVLSTDLNYIVCRTCKSTYFAEIMTNVLSKANKKDGSSSRPQRPLFHTIVSNAQVKVDGNSDPTSQFDAAFGEGNYRYMSGDMLKEVCKILSADVVVVTGSTFPSALLQFAKRDKPILLEEQRHNRNIAKQVNKWFTSPENALHLMNGTIVQYKDMNTDADRSLQTLLQLSL